MATIYSSIAGGRAVEARYLEFLARWPVPSEHLRLPTSQGETFVVACGPPDGPPLLLFHGSTANATAWMGDVAAWSERFRVYAVDLIGEPGLSAPSRPPLHSDAYARWLDDVLDGLAADRASVVGVSLGGWLALDYATRRPERVERLAVLCPGGVGRQKWAALVAALLLAPFGRRGARAAMRLILGCDPPATPEAAEFAEFMALIARHFRPRMVHYQRFSDEALRKLTMPTLAILGSRDAIFDSAGTGHRLDRLLPHATIEVRSRTGHLILGYTATVLDFLERPATP